MFRVTREVFIPKNEGRCVWPGFVSYVSATDPVLLHRSGWVDQSDTFDEYADSISRDGGATWSAPVLRQRKEVVAGGEMRYAENAAFFDEAAGRLLTFSTRMFYPGGRHSSDLSRPWIEHGVYDPASGDWTAQTWRFGPPQGIQISFCFPLLTRAGRLLVPAFCRSADRDGALVKYPGTKWNLFEAVTIIGDRRKDGAWDWHAGMPCAIDGERSCRGLGENTLAELADGRLAMIARGSNAAWPDRPGCKWLAFSGDAGESWDTPRPLCFDDGTPAASPSSGSALVRSIRNGRLYWIGNLAPDGAAVKGNYPRAPLVRVEVQENPFALRRDTLRIIDCRAPGEPEQVQMSNFRYYQERGSGDILLFLTRLFERDPGDFRDADYYRYRIPAE